jgi:hypothetical protein
VLYMHLASNNYVRAGVLYDYQQAYAWLP